MILSKFEHFSSAKFTKIQISKSLKLPKITFLDCLNSPKFDFKQNLSGSKMIKFRQSQALTSHFKSFWSLVIFEQFLPETYLLTLTFSIEISPFLLRTGTAPAVDWMLKVSSL